MADRTPKDRTAKPAPAKARPTAPRKTVAASPVPFADAGQPVAGVGERGHVTRQRRGVAGHVDDRPRTGARQQPAHRLPGSGPRRIQDDDVRRAAQLLEQLAQKPGHEQYILRYFGHRLNRDTLKIVRTLR